MGIRAKSAVDVVEAAYRLDDSETDWLASVVEAARADLDCGYGVYAFTGEETAPNLAKSPVFVERAVPPAVLGKLAELNATAPKELFERLARRVVTCGGLEQILGADSAAVAHFRALMGDAGVLDGFCTFAQDGQGGSITLSAPASAPLSPSPRVRGIWQRVGIHVVAGLRLRRKLASRSTVREALLDPSGKVEDASAVLARDGASRRALAEAVRAMDRSRRASVRSSPAEALDLWRGLVAGQWSLVDHWEHGGRRYVAAYPNRPGERDPRALTPSEQSVLRYLSMGATNKEVSYSLGLSEKTVSGCVTRILKKLRVRSRVELAAVLEARRASRFDLTVIDERLSVLEVEFGAGRAITDRLTGAEREVATAVARGWSNARIAAARAVSTSTVAKQLQAIYDKLGVDNRSQLARVMTHADDPADRSRVDGSTTDAGLPSA